MTIAELKELISEYPDYMQVVIQGSLSDYVDDIRDCKRKMVASMWGNDFEAVVIRSDGQAGRV